MSAEFLARPTPAGSHPEYQFDANGDCSWVLFRPPDSDDWVGVFGRERWGGTIVSVVWPLERAFVIAVGKGYLINTSSRELLYRSHGQHFEEVVHVPDRAKFVAADNLRLYVIDHQGLAWATPRMFFDGIRGLCVTGAVVSGEAWQNGPGAGSWSAFTFDLDTNAVTGSAYDPFPSVEPPRAT
jgi:hypothetical protein